MRRYRCRKISGCLVADIRNSILTGTWTQKELLAFREADANRLQALWKEAKVKETEAPRDLWDALATKLNSESGYRTDVSCVELDGDGEMWDEALGSHPWENYMYTCDLNTACTYRATTSEPAEYEMEGWVRVDNATTGVTIEERSASELW